METLRILVVEDDSSVMESYRSSATAHNRITEDEDGIQIKLIEKQTKEQAIEALNNSANIYDGAIVDLDLEGAGGQDTSGEDVIRDIKSNLRFPIFIISGTTENLDSDLQECNDLYKVISRDEEFDYIEEFIKIHKTGITKILNKKGLIEQYINDIFWNHLSNSVNLWVEDETRQPAQKEKSMLRYVLHHLQEYLEINSKEKSHPSEFYISEPIKKELYTGDIILKDGIRYVVLNPACHFSGKKVDSVFCIPMNSLESIEEGKFAKSNFEIDSSLDASLEKKRVDKLRDKLNPYLLNAKPRFHFMPKLGSYAPAILDFQKKNSFEFSSLIQEISTGSVKRIATVSQPFLKDVIQRYSSYFSGQGSPDFSHSELFSQI